MTTRRQLLKSLPAVVGLGLLGTSSFASAQERRRAKKADAGEAAGTLAPVDPAKDPMAKSVNYVEKHADLKKAELKTERQGVQWEKQYCKDCQLHTVIPGQTARVGCTLFSGKSVAAEGWCSSWAKKS